VTTKWGDIFCRCLPTTRTATGRYVLKEMQIRDRKWLDLWIRRNLRGHCRPYCEQRPADALWLHKRPQDTMRWFTRPSVEWWSWTALFLVIDLEKLLALVGVAAWVELIQLLSLLTLEFQPISEDFDDNTAYYKNGTYVLAILRIFWILRQIVNSHILWSNLEFFKMHLQRFHIYTRCRT